MSNKLETIDTKELKKMLVVRCLMNPDLRDIALGREAMDFMTKLLFSYAEIDPRAVFGAEHMVEFFKSHYVGPREFAILRKICKDDCYNFVLLSRGRQLGILDEETITNHFIPSRHICKPIDFDDLDKKVNRDPQNPLLIRPKTEEVTNAEGETK
jgi:hypothetical protein